MFKRKNKESKKKSILIITERFYPEEFGINDLVLSWQQKGYKVFVLTQTPSYPFDKVYDGYKNKLFQKEVWEDIVIYRIFTVLGYKKKLFLKIWHYIEFSFLASIVSLFIFRKFSKVFVYQIGPLTQIIPGMVLKLLFRKKLYLWILDLWPESVFAYGFKHNKLSSFLLNLFVKLSYFSTDAIFVSCKGFIDRVKALSPGAKLIFAPQWAPLNLNFDNISPREELKKCFNFTFAGNIGKVQNLENIIKGFALIHPGKKAILNIVGDGSNLSNLKLLVENEKIKNVVFHGKRPLVEMPEWFAGSDVLIISLLDKPVFSLTVPAKFQAYLTANKPIFCIMNGEVASIVKKNDIGIISKPDDIMDIKNGFEHFIDLDIDSLRGVARNTEKLLENEYQFDKIMKAFTDEMFFDISS